MQSRPKGGGYREKLVHNHGGKTAYREKLVRNPLKYKEKLVHPIEKNWSMRFYPSQNGVFTALTIEKNWSIA